MSSTIQRFSTPSADPDAASVDWSAVEAAAWELFEPYAATRTAVWVDVSSPRLYKNANAGDAASDFELINRCGGSVLVGEPFYERHPVIIQNDSISGLPCLCLGAGGAGGNVLAAPAHGVMVFRDEYDSGNVNVGNRSMIFPNTGWTFAGKFRFPVNGATVNGVTFPNPVQGAVMGAAAEAEADAWEMELASNGKFRAFNRHGVVTVGQWLETTAAMNDSLWHDYVFTYDDAAGSMSAWTDGVAVTPITGVTTDIHTSAGCSKMLIGGAGYAGGAVSIRRMDGFGAIWMWLPSPIGNDSAARTKLRNLMAAR